MEAAAHGDLGYVRRALGQGNIYVDYPYGGSSNAAAGIWRGRTALMAAAWNNHPQVVSALLQAGANVNTKVAQGGSEPGWTALHSASRADASGIVAALIRAGAEVDGKTDKGQTPLDRASYFGSTAAARVLIREGADVNAVDNRGFTPLHNVRDYSDTARLLINSGAMVNARTNAGDTPILMAAWNNRASVVPILLQNGADPCLINHVRTAAAAARDNNHEGLAKLLDPHC